MTATATITGLILVAETRPTTHNTEFRFYSKVVQGLEREDTHGVLVDGYGMTVEESRKRLMAKLKTYQMSGTLRWLKYEGPADPEPTPEHRLSDKQFAYIKSLHEKLGTWGNAVEHTVSLYSRRKASEVIETLKQSVENKRINDAAEGKASPEDMATPKQLEYLRSLWDQTGNPCDEKFEEALSKQTRAQASSSINGLQTAIQVMKQKGTLPVPWSKQQAQASAQTSEAAPQTTWRPTDGMYKVGERIFKVQRAVVNGDGHPYAKELIRTEQRGGDIKHSFKYVPGAMKLLKEEHKMTLEQAKEYGALYGTCCVCGRTLTNEESIAAGIGPICAEKGGW